MVAVTAPVSAAVLAPVLSPCSRSPSTLVVPFRAEVSVPWKVPWMGGTNCATQVPVFGKAVQPPGNVEKPPDRIPLPVGAVPARFRSCPNSLIVMFRFCPSNVPVTGPTPEHPSPRMTLPLRVSHDCTRNPEKVCGSVAAWRFKVIDQFPEREEGAGFESLVPHATRKATVNKTQPSRARRTHPPSEAHRQPTNTLP